MDAENERKIYLRYISSGSKGLIKLGYYKLIKWDLLLMDMT